MVLVDRDGSAERFLTDYVDALGGGALGDDREILPVVIRDDEPVDPALFAGAAGLAVAGGLTPRYHAALVGCAEAIRAAVGNGMPYAGFSAGAMIAPDTALLGGHLLGDVEVVHEDCSEGLGPLTVRPGPRAGAVRGRRARGPGRAPSAAPSRWSKPAWSRKPSRSTRTPASRSAVT